MKNAGMTAAGMLLGSLSLGTYAQSSVTLYGVADVGIEYLSNAPSSSGGNNLVRMSAGNMSTSRWGLRGTEDLGGGLKALFELESGFSLDTGQSSSAGRLFDRSALVGLASQYGQLTLGRQTTVLYDTAIQFDPMGFAPRYSLYKSDDTIAGRAANAVKYKGSFGGMTAMALYSFGRTGGGEVPGEPKVDREMSAGLIYSTGPLSVGALYDEYQGSTVALQGLKDRRALVGVSYGIGPAKLYAGYRWFNGNISASATGTRSNLYWAGLRYQLTSALSLAGAAYYTDVRGSGADPLMFVASTDYAFSKRTDLYFNVGYVRNRGGSQLGVNGFNASSGTPVNVVPGDNQTGVVLGVRHKF